MTVEMKYGNEARYNDCQLFLLSGTRVQTKMRKIIPCHKLEQLCVSPEKLYVNFQIIIVIIICPSNLTAGS